MVRSNMPAEAVVLGERVRVPWGLDKLEGVVVDVYETGSGRRVVVEVSLPGRSDDPDEVTTIALPEEAVETLRQGSTAISPGAWVTGLRYERSVGEALERLASEVLDRGQVFEGHRRSDQGVDFLLLGEPRPIVVEVKTSRPPREITVSDLRKLLGRLRSETFPGKAVVLLVTDQKLTPDAEEFLNNTARLRVVRWRDSRDDSRLAAALKLLVQED
jgi:restriction endonuclease